MGRNLGTIYHDFYCIKCGKKGLPLPRKKSMQKERFHRKKLYCPNCKITINHVECKDEFDVYDFQEMFRDGEFLEEVEESLRECEEK